MRRYLRQIRSMLPCGASCSVSISDSSWYVVSRTASRSGNTATANLTMGRRALGVTVSTSNYTITLSCDKSGNLS